MEPFINSTVLGCTWPEEHTKPRRKNAERQAASVKYQSGKTNSTIWFTAEPAPEGEESKDSKSHTSGGMITMKSSRSRGWVYTIWPEKREGLVKDLHEHIKADEKIQYAVFGHELTEDGREHLQGFVYWENAVTGKGAQRRLGLSHGEFRAAAQRGTHAQASDYCKKDGNLAIVHGEIPDPEDRPESAWDYILIMIENGATDSEIMRAYPAHFGRCRAGIAAMRMELLSEKLNTWREVRVEYVWGPTGSGKTRGVLESVDSPQDVFRVTDYKHPFDAYRGQSVLMLEEFRSSLPIEQMLIYLDGYYSELPCRYSNKVSGWDTVYIVTNIPLEQQYKNVQLSHPETWDALLRRIDAQVHKGHLKGNYSPLDDHSFEELCTKRIAEQWKLQEKTQARVQASEEMLGRPPEGYTEWQLESKQSESTT